MSKAKFSVGDVIRFGNRGCSATETATITGDGISTLYFTTESGHKCYESLEVFETATLVSTESATTKETKPMARRTFRLLKDTPSVRRGALYQEDCDDGTQPYSCINTSEYAKDPTKKLGNVSTRSLIEEQPEWFVEVFKVEPEYMTREELDRYEVFLNTGYRAKPVKKTRVSKTGKRLGRPLKKA